MHACMQAGNLCWGSCRHTYMKCLCFDSRLAKKTLPPLCFYSLADGLLACMPACLRTPVSRLSIFRPSTCLRVYISVCVCLSVKVVESDLVRRARLAACPTFHACEFALRCVGHAVCVCASNTVTESVHSPCRNLTYPILTHVMCNH